MISSAAELFGSSSGRGCLVPIYPAGLGRGLIEVPANEFVIGRGADADLPVNDSAVSRRHMSIAPKTGHYVVTDLKSTNGTFVNDDRIDSRILQNGDFIRVGSHIFKFLCSDHVEILYHETIYMMMITDGLTGVHNKRVFCDTLERELVRSQRRFRPLALVIFDIDHFKRINDTHGHLAGDAVLRDICSRIKQNVRKDEVFARYGGEEFCVLLPEAHLDEAHAFAERLRCLVAETPVVVNNVPINVTISIGIAFTPGQPEITPENLVAEADRLLYEAKNAGRNRVHSPLGALALHE